MILSARHRERFRKIIHRYQGRAVGFRCDEIGLPNHKKATREYLTHPGAVGILAFPRPGKILLVKQYRHPVHQFTLEIPAGKLSAGEKPLSCVRRELEEETGYRAPRIQKLISFWPTAAFSNEVIHLFMAQNLIRSRPQPDDDEFLEVVTATARQMARWIRTGRIRDSKTIIAYLLWEQSAVKKQPSRSL